MNETGVKIRKKEKRIRIWFAVWVYLAFCEKRREHTIDVKGR